MPKKQRKHETLITKLRQVDRLVSRGSARTDAFRSVGVSEGTYNRWRQGLGGLKNERPKSLKESQD